jgi:poly(3-hydroxyoctanoate) depolymerase
VPSDPSITCFKDLVISVASRIDRPTALVAQSMGGVLAIEATLRKPFLITHLVLAATSGGLNTARFGAIDWRGAFKQEQPNVPDWFTSYNSDLTAKLGAIDVPVLLIWGDQDPISPIAVGQELLHLFPHAELHVLAGGEHDVARTHSQSIAPVVEMHLQK